MEAQETVKTAAQPGIDTFHNVYEVLTEYLVKNGLNAAYGLLIFFIGFKVAGWVGKLFEDFLKKRHLDLTLAKFLAGTVKIVIIGFSAMIMLEKFGITISPIIAAISAAIFGASFAVQAPLSNYAAGLSIVLSRPFKVGDTVTIKEYSGLVEDIRIPFTVLLTSSGEKITIPNKHIVGEVLINSFENKMFEAAVGISYSDDPENAIRVIREALKSLSGVLQQPAPLVGIDSFGDSSINIGIKYWTQTKVGGTARADVNLTIFRALQKAKITIPFPQSEVRMLQN